MQPIYRHHAVTVQPIFSRSTATSRVPTCCFADPANQGIDRGARESFARIERSVVALLVGGVYTSRHSGACLEGVAGYVEGACCVVVGAVLHAHLPTMCPLTPSK